MRNLESYVLPFVFIVAGILQLYGISLGKYALTSGWVFIISGFLILGIVVFLNHKNTTYSCTVEKDKLVKDEHSYTVLIDYFCKFYYSVAVLYISLELMGIFQNDYLLTLVVLTLAFCRGIISRFIKNN